VRAAGDNRACNEHAGNEQKQPEQTAGWEQKENIWKTQKKNVMKTNCGSFSRQPAKTHQKCQKHPFIVKKSA